MQTPHDPREALDEGKRREILALIANGSSQRVAARYVGCHRVTILRTARRDPQFGAALKRAQQKAEVEALRNIRNAGRKEQYWRAAAWFLERRNPADFAPKKLDDLTESQVNYLIEELAVYLQHELSDEAWDRVLKKLRKLLARLPSDDYLRMLAKELPPPGRPVRSAASISRAQKISMKNWTRYTPGLAGKMCDRPPKERRIAPTRRALIVTLPTASSSTAAARGRFSGIGGGGPRKHGEGQSFRLREGSAAFRGQADWRTARGRAGSERRLRSQPKRSRGWAP